MIRVIGLVSVLGGTLRVQVLNNHILSQVLTYITTILNPSTLLLGPLDPWGNMAAVRFQVCLGFSF